MRLCKYHFFGRIYVNLKQLSNLISKAFFHYLGGFFREKSYISDTLVALWMMRAQFPKPDKVWHQNSSMYCLILFLMRLQQFFLSCDPVNVLSNSIY